MQAALLSDRGVVEVAGQNARKFLNGLLTSDVGKLRPAHAAFAALLTPQGKIIVDFIVAAASEGEAFALDCPRALAPALKQRLDFYKLRAQVTVEDRSQALGVLAIWDGPPWPPPHPPPQAEEGREGALYFQDPRLPELGLRCILAPELAGDAAAEIAAQLVDASAYETHRIALGVPRGGLDFIYGDAFPHETDMDQLGGVDFNKGCFVGQEVVSRIEHRASARTRVVPVAYDGPAPAPGIAVTAGERNVGMMGSAAAGRGLAALRLDRVEEAQAGGVTLVAGGIALKPVKPAWARFAWPGEATPGK